MVEAKERRAPANQAVLFLLYQNGKYLFEITQDKNSSYYGKLRVPSGKLEQGEVDSDALVREFQEELGASPIDMIFLDSFRNITPAGEPYLLHAYLVLEVKGDIATREPRKAQHKWLTFREARPKLEFVDSIYTLALAKKYLNEARQNKG